MSGAASLIQADVAEVLVRYATGIDQRDWPLFRTCFTSDCEADYGRIGHWHGIEEITDWMTRVHADCGYTLHRITNIVVIPESDERVSARCYVDALVLGADNRSGVRAAGFYEDDLIRADGGWRIARRRFTPVHHETVGVGRTT